jgi:hypothetical protein
MKKLLAIATLAFACFAAHASGGCVTNVLIYVTSGSYYFTEKSDCPVTSLGAGAYRAPGCSVSFGCGWAQQTGDTVTISGSSPGTVVGLVCIQTHDGSNYCADLVIPDNACGATFSWVLACVFPCSGCAAVACVSGAQNCPE